MTERRDYRLSLYPRQLVLKLIVGLLGCHSSTGFLPLAHRIGSSAAIWRTDISHCRAGWSMKAAPEHVTSRSIPTLQHSAIVCLATATILSASIPADAMLPELSSAVGGGRSQMHGSPAVILLSEDEPLSALDPSALSVTPSETNDVPGLVSELRGADKPDRLLGTMIKINEMLNADKDGLAEDSVAKESIMRGLIDKRKAGGEVWDSDTEIASSILKRKLDPFSLVVLRPYFRIAPFLGGFYYLAAFFVQQKFRAFFPTAYFAAVAIFVAPAAILLLIN